MRGRNKKKKRPVQVRLRKDFVNIKKSPKSDYFQVYDLVQDNIQVWEIYVIGPPDTPYDKGVYKAHLHFPDEYPMKPPFIRFISKMLHPNIYKDGKVCISTLQTGKDGSDNLGVYWRPVLGIEQAILSVVSLLSDPNLDDPANVAASTLMKNHKEKFLAQCAKLAVQSWSMVPDDFEFPKVEQNKSGPVKSKVEKEIVKENDDWSYDQEDLSTLGSKLSRGKEYIYFIDQRLRQEVEDTRSVKEL